MWFNEKLGVNKPLVRDRSNIMGLCFLNKRLAAKCRDHNELIHGIKGKTTETWPEINQRKRVVLVAR